MDWLPRLERYRKVQARIDNIILIVQLTLAMGGMAMIMNEFLKAL